MRKTPWWTQTFYKLSTRNYVSGKLFSFSCIHLALLSSLYLTSSFHLEATFCTLIIWWKLQKVQKGLFFLKNYIEITCKNPNCPGIFTLRVLVSLLRTDLPDWRRGGGARVLFNFMFGDWFLVLVGHSVCVWGKAGGNWSYFLLILGSAWHSPLSGDVHIGYFLFQQTNHSSKYYLFRKL